MKTILCIDVRRQDLAALTSVVEQAGYRVLAADSTRRAMALFSSNQVDGVLLRQRCCSDLEAHTMQRHFHHLAPGVPVLLFDGPAEVTASALPWMESYMQSGQLARTNA
ncbi:MAG TPA: hypothetical protein VFU76_15245 [Terriglobales bacterium]|nr:hypothetical protein [Terriglobales bacterium]